MPSIRSTHINGALAFWEAHRKRIVDAIGGDVLKYIDDFVVVPGTDATLDPWIVTLVEAGAGETTVGAGDVGNGTLQITTDAAENDGANLQLRGESFKLETGKPVYFGARVQSISDVVQSDLFVGLAITDTDILGGVTDRIGFEKLDGSAALAFVVEKDSTETNVAAVATLVNATAAILEFYWDGVALEVFVDGVSVASPSIANLPNDEELRVSLQFLTGEAVAKTLHVDWMRCIKFGRQ